MDNDDLDVTKGCEIIVTVSDKKDDLVLNPLPQKPHILQSKDNILCLYAGRGVGVVTKKGLKTKPNFPAINPTPLKEMQKIYKRFMQNHKALILYSCVSVKNAEEIAKNTANKKVGVIGGISILGTSGFVKPVSSEAYLESIKTEIRFAKANGCKKIVFTIGNSSYTKAKRVYDETDIIEIGNFVYDSFKIAKDENIKDFILIAGIGKITKIALGFKNTHNRFGSIDFDEIQKWVGSDFEDIVTVKGLCEKLGNRSKYFYHTAGKRAKEQIKKWFKESKISINISEIFSCPSPNS